MPNFDRSPADVAIASMNPINIRIRKKPLFLIPFLLTPLAYISCGLLARYAINQNGLLFYLAAISYIVGVILVTSSVSEPLNFQLGHTTPNTPNQPDIWQTYSRKWQFWNMIRTLSSGLSIILFFLGTLPVIRNR